MGVELLQRRLSNLQRTLQLASAACFFALIWLFSLTSIPGALMGTVLKAEDPLVTFAANFSTSVTFFWVTIYFTVVLGALVPAVVWINFKLRAFYRHDPRTKQAEGDATFTEWMKANQFSLESFNFFGIKEGAAILAPFVPILLARLGTALPLLTG